MSNSLWYIIVPWHSPHNVDEDYENDIKGQPTFVTIDVRTHSDEEVENILNMCGNY